jgi:thiol-disulfide isomerase/thioredoxin
LRTTIGGLLIAAACTIAPAWAGAPAMTAVVPARTAPDFTLRDIDGKPHRLVDYRGKVVLVNFWATWCPPVALKCPRLRGFMRR